MIKLAINGQEQVVDLPDETPLLWVIREEICLTGTKFGCGRGLCGACTVLLNGAPVRSCVLPVVAAQNQAITTIEGLADASKHALTKVQEAWKVLDVVQCGYCQSGQILCAYALLAANPRPTDDQIIQAMTGQLCRCGTYPRILAAVRHASKLLVGEKP